MTQNLLPLSTCTIFATIFSFSICTGFVAGGEFHRTLINNPNKVVGTPRHMIRALRGSMLNVEARGKGLYVCWDYFHDIKVH